MAQGVAWDGRAKLGVTATIAVPEHTPEAKLAAITRLGGQVLKLPYDQWWQVIVTSQVPRRGTGCSSTPCRTRR